MINRRSLIAYAIVSGALGGISNIARAAGAVEMIVCKIALAEGRVWVAIKIAGSEPMLFTLDSGAAVSAIKPDMAMKLGLVDVAKVNARRGVAPSRSIYVAKNVNIGGGVVLDSLDLTTGDRLARDAAGSLSVGMLTTMDSDLDFEAGEWRAYPAGRADRSGFERLKSDIDLLGRGSARMFATGLLNGQAFDFMLDTGTTVALHLDSAATAKSGLWDSTRPYAPVAPAGEGGMGKRGRLVRVDSFELGTLKINRPIIMLSDPDENVLGRRRDGVIGLPILRHLTLSTDIKNSKVWIKRNGLTPELLKYRLSGLWVDQQNGKTTVVDVGRGSPAEEAGIVVGDLIVGETMGAFLGRSNGAVGTPVSVEIERRGVKLRKQFVLKRYL